MASVILVVHALWAGFIVVTIPCVLLGQGIGWGWILSPWIRSLHLLATGIVFAETVFGLPCPLTWLENRLRHNTGRTGYSQNGCVMDWFTRVTGLSLPPAAFNVFYVLLFFGVLALFFAIPPRRVMAS